MVTEFGKFCRNLRMENAELLKDMADALQVKSSFLSAVELGKKSIPSSWRDHIISMYNLTNKEIERLDTAISESVRHVKFDLDEYSKGDRDLIIAFARSFPSLSDDEKQIIKSNIKRGKG